MTYTDDNYAVSVGGDEFLSTNHCDGEVTATFTWVPGYVGELPPKWVIVKEFCEASWWGPDVEDTTAALGDCGNGRSDSVENWRWPDGTIDGGTSVGTHYKVTRAGQSFSVSCTPTSHLGTWGVMASTIYAVSIVNGGWAGPYYFHSGEYNYAGKPSPLATNTAGEFPVITDFPDGTHSFGASIANDYMVGSYAWITPVWYWTGPDLGPGVLPPPFTVDVGAKATETTGNVDDAGYSSVSDGINDTSIPNLPPGTMQVNDLAEYDVTIQSTVTVPGEGNGYWALGPTIDMQSTSGGATSCSRSASVELDAWIALGLNN